MSSTLDTPSRRVLIVVENLPVPLDRRVWLEATALRANGYLVSVICPMGRGWDAPYEEIDGVHIYRHPAPPEAHAGALAYAREYLHAIWHWFRLARIVRRERGFDVIHGCNPPDLVWLLALRYRLSGVRYLFDHHDVCPELFHAKFGKRGLLYRVMLWWERLTFICADVSLATNESFAKIAQERGGMAPEDVFVVRSAPKIETFLPGPGASAYRKGTTVLGWIGIIGQQEGLDLLVEAVNHVVTAGHDVHVLIIGFGPHQSVVEAQVAAAGLENRFTFTGALYGKATLAALNAIDIGLAPDPKNPMNDISTMNKVMEYMTLEKPVVQFDLTEGRASAGDTARYATNNDPQDFADQIMWLIKNPETAAQMGKAGRARVLSQLSWDHSVPNLLAAYDRIFAKAGKAPNPSKTTAADGP